MSGAISSFVNVITTKMSCLLTVFCLTNTNGSMIVVCRKFHTNRLACLRGFYDQLCQMMRIGKGKICKRNLTVHNEMLSYGSILFLPSLHLVRCMQIIIHSTLC